MPRTYLNNMHGNTAVIGAQVPMNEMFGYIGGQRALSSGRAQHSMQFEGTIASRRAKVGEPVDRPFTHWQSDFGMRTLGSSQPQPKSAMWR